MSILSFEFLGLAAISSILSWLFYKHTRPFLVALANIAFLFFLRANVMDIAYAVGLFLFTWLFAYLIQKQHSKVLLIIGIIVPVVGLCFFKYQHYVFHFEHLLMPLGLSFYTFKALSYIIDVFKGDVKAKNPLLVFDYILYFPSFLAGPIHRSGPFFEELENPFYFDYKDQKNGCVQAAFGLFQKLVIGDYFSSLVKILLEPGAFDGWYVVLGVVLYAFYIYVDFDSYSNVAIGIARMMGFHLDRNFHTPYLAVSIRDFWNRWHRSLSGWLRDYIYIPLGGSRHGFFRKCLNVLIIFIISGLWHGSTMMFLVWGIGHGLLNILEDIIRKAFGGVKSWMAFLSPLAILINFIFVSLLWVFFRSSSMNEAFSILQAMTHISLGSFLKVSYETIGITLNEWIWMWGLLGLVILTDICRYYRDMIAWLSRRFILFRWLIYIIVGIIAIIFGVYGPGYNPEEFIYVTF